MFNGCQTAMSDLTTFFVKKVGSASADPPKAEKKLYNYSPCTWENNSKFYCLFILYLKYQHPTNMLLGRDNWI